jgi:hypothetical protein
VRRLDDASWSFFVFLGQEGIFIGSGACLLCGGCGLLWWCVRERRQSAPTYKAQGGHRPRSA